MNAPDNETVLANIDKLAADVEQNWSVLNPYHLCITSRGMLTKKAELQPQYHQALAAALDAPFQSLSGGGGMGGMLAALSYQDAASTRNVVRLQTAWGNLNSTIDRKLALGVAIASIYISVLLGAGGLWLSLHLAPPESVPPPVLDGRAPSASQPDGSRAEHANAFVRFSRQTRAAR